MAFAKFKVRTGAKVWVAGVDPVDVPRAVDETGLGLGPRRTRLVPERSVVEQAFLGRGGDAVATA